MLLLVTRCCTRTSKLSCVAYRCTHANLDVMSDENGKVLVRGSLMVKWDVPQIVDGTWFLHILNELPDIAGPKATMDAFCIAMPLPHQFSVSETSSEPSRNLE